MALAFVSFYEHLQQMYDGGHYQASLVLDSHWSYRALHHATQTQRRHLAIMNPDRKEKCKERERETERQRERERDRDREKERQRDRDRERRRQRDRDREKVRDRERQRERERETEREREAQRERQRHKERERQRGREGGGGGKGRVGTFMGTTPEQVPVLVLPLTEPSCLRQLYSLLYFLESVKWWLEDV